MTASTYESFLDNFTNLYISLKFEFVPMSILKKVSDVGGSKDLRILVSSINEEADDSNEPDINFDFEPLKSSYMKVQFITDIEANVRRKIDQDSSNKIPNGLIDGKIAKYLLRKLGPTCILWSSFVHKRFSNSISEAHNKIIKRNIIRGAASKPGSIIRDLRASQLANMKKITTSQNFKTKLKKNHSLPDPKESFKKPKMEKITKFDQVESNVEKMISQSLYDSLDRIINIAKSKTDNSNKSFKIVHEISSSNSILMSKFVTLNNNQWLNGDVIIAYQKMMMAKFKNVFIVDSYMVEKMSRQKYQEIAFKQIHSDVDFFSCEKIFSLLIRIKFTGHLSNSIPKI